MKTHGMSVISIRRTKMLELDLLEHQHVEMWWNYKSGLTMMERLLTQSSRPSDVDQLSVSVTKSYKISSIKLTFIISLKFPRNRMGQRKDTRSGRHNQKHRHRKRTSPPTRQITLFKWVTLFFISRVPTNDDNFLFTFLSVLAEDAIRAALADYKKKQIPKE